MTLQEIEAAITQLPAQEVDELMAWLEEYHAQIWDRQIESDLEAGRLDALLSEVEKEKQYKAGLAEPQDSAGRTGLTEAIQRGWITLPIGRKPESIPLRLPITQWEELSRELDEDRGE